MKNIFKINESRNNLMTSLLEGEYQQGQLHMLFTCWNIIEINTL